MFCKKRFPDRVCQYHQLSRSPLHLHWDLYTFLLLLEWFNYQNCLSPNPYLYAMLRKRRAESLFDVTSKSDNAWRVRSRLHSGKKSSNFFKPLVEEDVIGGGIRWCSRRSHGSTPQATHISRSFGEYRRNHSSKGIPLSDDFTPKRIDKICNYPYE